MKKWIAVAFCVVLLSGCAYNSNQDNRSSGVSPENVPVSPYEDTQPSDEPTATVHPDSSAYLDEYLPSQLSAARDNGVTEEFLRRYVEESRGQLEALQSKLNAPIPPQSSLDRAVIDARIEYYTSKGGYMDLRNETAILLTVQKGEIYYSFIMSATIEFGGPCLVAWKQDGDAIQILGSYGADYPFSIPPVSPTVRDIEGMNVMFSLLHNDALFGGDNTERRHVNGATFSVTMANGDVITQDVSELPCIMVFLPSEEYTYWSLTDQDGTLIWDSMDSTYTS